MPTFIPHSETTSSEYNPIILPEEVLESFLQALEDYIINDTYVYERRKVIRGTLTNFSTIPDMIREHIVEHELMRGQQLTKEEYNNLVKTIENRDVFSNERLSFYFSAKINDTKENLENPEAPLRTNFGVHRAKRETQPNTISKEEIQNRARIAAKHTKARARAVIRDYFINLNIERGKERGLNLEALRPDSRNRNTAPRISNGAATGTYSKRSKRQKKGENKGRFKYIRS